MCRDFLKGEMYGTLFLCELWTSYCYYDYYTRILHIMRCDFTWARQNVCVPSWCSDFSTEHIILWNINLQHVNSENLPNSNLNFLLNICVPLVWICMIIFRICAIVVNRKFKNIAKCSLSSLIGMEKKYYFEDTFLRNLWILLWYKYLIWI